MSFGPLVVSFVSISMRMSFWDLFDVWIVVWVDQMGIEFHLEFRVCVICVTSSLFIMFGPISVCFCLLVVLCLHLY